MPNDPTLLVIGHPGHELRSYEWMRKTRPTVLVLTDGGGAKNHPRIERTRGVVTQAGAVAGQLFGTFTDRDLYRFLIDGTAEPLVEWTSGVAATIACLRPTTVVSDMIEGYNPSHDLCRYLVRAAIEMAARSGWPVREDLCMPLTGNPQEAWGGRLRWSQRIVLSDAQLAEKLLAARGYPELLGEVEAALASHGAECFRNECFYASPPGSLLDDGLPGGPPLYESYGAGQVQAGLYEEVILYQQHVRPLVCSVRGALGLL